MFRVQWCAKKMTQCAKKITPVQKNDPLCKKKTSAKKLPLYIKKIFH